MRKFLAVTLIALLAISAVKAEYTEEDDVVVLNDDNFDEFIKANEFVLVEFYAPWCGHCKQLAPEYSRAAKELKQGEVKVPLVKVDATENKVISDRFKIQGFPTLKFFSSGNEVEYNGGRKEKEIISWIQKRVGQITTDLKDTEGLKAFSEKHQVAIVYFGSPEDTEYGIFKSVAMGYDSLAFGHVSDEAARQSVNQQAKGITLFKAFDEKRNDFSGEFNTENVKNFIENNSFATVMPFDDRAIEKVFQQGKPTIFLFKEDNEAGEKALEEFTAAATSRKGTVIFSISRPNDGFGHYTRLAEYIGADTSKAPLLMLVHASDDMAKYRFTGDITAANIIDFVSRFTEGKLTRHFKSEDIPATNDEPVKVIVGANFQELVLDNDKDVLVMFYAEWCGHCKSLKPKYEAAAKRLAANKKIVLAKCDATKNEVPGVSVRGFPTLKFWAGNKKSEGPVDFEGGREEEDIIKFFKEKSSHAWVEEEKKEDL